MYTIMRRCIERDYVFNTVKKSKNYITDEEINSMLVSMQWVDYTFKFLPKSSGWITVVIDNDTNNRVEIDELNGFAYDFYIRNVTELSVDRARKQIREKLYSEVAI
ncbi:hypothetical protein [Paenibacillus elgii]|uniref:hypothetical protein n=1 Tax=Paenibacillus elgii TaxID=189691 RepID=UPI00203E1357|nr:hypothetical protein [Paenibacillus elgii]MCM3274199.1 hypothetical protein [Paenibacillus elgii]